MRTNQASLALSIGMGLIVLLIGFLALSAAGLVSFGQAEVEIAELPISGESLSAKADSSQLIPTTYKTYQAVMPPDAGAIAAGDALFKNNCAQCHAVNEKVVGPALAGVTTRRKVSWLIAWVRNPAKVIASGEEYAVKLYEANDKQQMPAFSNFSEKDVKAILTWIEAQEGQSYTACLPVPPAVATR